MPVELRPYQKKLVEDVRAAFRAGKRSPLIVLPTGGGKTVVFCHMVRAAYDKGLRVLILAHRVELLDQICRMLSCPPDISRTAASVCRLHRCSLTCGAWIVTTSRS
jgi:superfamily II DNA or RNA helicase